MDIKKWASARVAGGPGGPVPKREGFQQALSFAEDALAKSNSMTDANADAVCKTLETADRNLRKHHDNLKAIALMGKIRAVLRAKKWPGF